MDIRRTTNVAQPLVLPSDAQKGQPGVAGNLDTNLTTNAVKQAGTAENTKTAEENKQQKPLDKDALKQSVTDTNQALQMMSTSLELSIDDESGTMVAKVVDKDTNKVIRQIPSEEMIELAKRIDEFKSLLTSQKA